MPSHIDKRIKVFLIEDSRVQRELLIYILESDPEIKVIGVATNGEEGIAALKNLKPDLVITDLHMPKMNGVEAIRYIMSNNPIPIIAISASSSIDDAVNGFCALEAGALIFAEVPKNVNSPQYIFQRDYLLKTIKLMSEIKVVRRWDKKWKIKNEIVPITKPQSILQVITNEINIIAIGASTGGPLALQEIISNLPPDFPPIVIVQHIASGFIEGLSEWLVRTTERPILVAKGGDQIKRGHVYLAPDHYNMGVHSSASIFLEKNSLNNTPCPSVGFLFNSVATAFHDKSMGILLTGMGTDGAAELKTMKDNGAITIAQGKESALIYGMPGQAVLLGAATYILTPYEIAETISGLGTTRGSI